MELMGLNYLLGFFHEEDPAGPGVHIEANQPVNVEQKVVFHGGRVHKAHS